MSARTRLILTATLLAISGASTLYGFRALVRFDATPGKIGGAPLRWPSFRGIDRTASGTRMLVFLHPLCACSFATLHELAKVPAEHRPGAALPRIDIFFYRPKDSGWVPGRLWKEAQQLPGSHVQWDDEGREARRFGATTSGFAVLYSPEGELLFSGGVTGSRGHEGTNFGIEQLIASVNSGKPAPEASFVFGCALGEQER